MVFVDYWSGMKDIIVIDNFISYALCDEIRMRCDDLKLKEVPAFYDEHIKEYALREKRIEKSLETSSMIALREYLEGSLSSPDGYEYNCSNVIVYPDGITLPMHLDNPSCRTPDNFKFTRTIGMICFLNDDFEGGELIFPNQDKVIKPEKGSLVIFPINHLYPHMVNTTVEGKRYALRINLFKNTETP